MAYTTLPTQSAGQTASAASWANIVKADLETMWRTLAYKSADQSVVSSTTLVDDTHLTFSIAANNAFVFSLMLAHTGGNLKVAFNAPAGATGWWAIDQSISGVSNPALTPTATFVDGENFGGTATSAVVKLDGYILNSATPGTFKLRWAQASASGTTVLKKGSWMQGQQVA